MPCLLLLLYLILLKKKLTDEKIKEELIPWKKTVDEHEDNRIIGKTMVRLEQSSCPMAECLIGNFITDAMVYAVSFCIFFSHLL